MVRRTSVSCAEKAEVRRIVAEKTGYAIKSTKILNQIFRRSSFAAETGQNSNEIFEFIGDTVLSFFVVKTVSERCGSLGLNDDYTFRISENKFTSIKQGLVNNEALAEIIDEWDIAKYLILGRSDIKNEVTKGVKVRADLFEAVIGGIAIDCEWDAGVLESVVSKALDIDGKITAMIETDAKVMNVDIDNAITTLKEMAESSRCRMPKYEFTGPEHLRYDKDGNPKWICDCHLMTDDERLPITRSVLATSKNEGKKAAAYLVLCEFLSMQNKYGENHRGMFWTYKDGKLFSRMWKE